MNKEIVTPNFGIKKKPTKKAEKIFPMVEIPNTLPEIFPDCNEFSEKKLMIIGGTIPNKINEGTMIIRDIKIHPICQVTKLSKEIILFPIKDIDPILRAIINNSQPSWLVDG